MQHPSSNSIIKTCSHWLSTPFQPDLNHLGYHACYRHLTLFVPALNKGNPGLDKAMFLINIITDIYYLMLLNQHQTMLSTWPHQQWIKPNVGPERQREKATTLSTQHHLAVDRTLATGLEREKWKDSSNIAWCQWLLH